MNGTEAEGYAGEMGTSLSKLRMEMGEVALGLSKVSGGSVMGFFL